MLLKLSRNKGLSDESIRACSLSLDKNSQVFPAALWCLSKKVVSQLGNNEERVNLS